MLSRLLPQDLPRDLPRVAYAGNRHSAIIGGKTEEHIHQCFILRQA